jgi:galactoside 2-L-fucosyltransferase 1/2
MTWVSFTYAGRLGNQLFSWASATAIAAKVNMSTCVTNHEVAVLSDAFQGDFPSLCNATLLWHTVPLENRNMVPRLVSTNASGPHSWCAQDIFLHHQNTYLNGALQVYTHFSDAAVLSQLHFRRHITSRAASFNRLIPASYTTVVGIHVRRGDGARAVSLCDQNTAPVSARCAFRQYSIAPADYFDKAMTYFRNRYANLCFLVIAELVDMSWIQAQPVFHGKDVFVNLEVHSAALDLSIIAACKHVIMSTGTFGWWAAFLSGGDVTYYLPDRKLRPASCLVDYYPKRWTCMMGCNVSDDVDFLRPATTQSATSQAQPPVLLQDLPCTVAKNAYYLSL